MSLKIAELQNRITSLEDQLSSITSQGEVSPEDAQRASEISGRLAEARDNLGAAALELQRENERIAAEVAANKDEVMHNMMDVLFGPKDSFQGIEPGWKGTAPMDVVREATLAAYAAGMPRNAVSGLLTPTYYDYDLPAPIAPIMGFLSTLPQGLTDGHETYFQAPVLTNAAAGWASGNKPESSLEWTQATAHIETIAHEMPIAKQTARRYRQLENTIIGALLLGLDIRKNAYAIAGSNSSGIVGARNLSGTLTYAKQADDADIRDIAIEMALRVRLATGFAPNYVVLSPQELAKARKAKDRNGRPMYEDIVRDGKLEGMTIIEDSEMHIVTVTGTGAEAVTTETDAMGVYFSGAAMWNTADPDQVEIGLVDKQFIQNTYTILAEGTHALKVTFPAAFCFCSDVNADVSSSSESGSGSGEGSGSGSGEGSGSGSGEGSGGQ